MLEHISVENFALLRRLEVPFRPGLNVMTGPTGAGKSLLIRALRLTLGDRADYDLLPDEGNARMSAQFRTPESFHWPEDVEPDDTLHLQRRLTQDHRTETTLNGRTIRLKTLREHRSELIDFHGQHEDQAVFEPDFPRRVLDRFGEHDDLLSTYRDKYQTLLDRERKLDDLTGSDESHEQRKELLRYQVRELEELNPGEDEWEHIEQRRKKLESAENIERSLSDALNHLEGEAGVTERLKRVRGNLESLREFVDVAEDWVQELPELQTTLEELRRQLVEVREDLPSGRESLEELMDRRGEWTRLARKHDVEPEQLYDYYQELQEELEALESRDEQIDELKAEIERRRSELRSQADDLSEARREAARTLASAVTDRLEQLNLEEGRFEVHVESDEELGPHGRDRVRWLFSSHTAHEPGPLEKRISGGEISRVLLALKAALAEADRTPVLVFDEVDTGISGEEAGRVGEVLSELADYHQVLCITHLPLVAAHADHHVRLTRRDEDEGVRVSLDVLDESGRVDEMSRLLSGDESSEASRRQARELIQSGG